jgi:hypothetical protein
MAVFRNNRSLRSFRILIRHWRKPGELESTVERHPLTEWYDGSMYAIAVQTGCTP